jgi:sensor histidine kinase regulating citrate/malate metabolism
VSFRIKTALGIVVVQVFLVSLLLISNHGNLTRTNHQQFLERARASAELLSSMVADAVVGLDLASIDAMISHTLRTNHLDYARVRNVDGLAIAQDGDPDALALPFVEDHTIEAATSDGRLDRAAPIIVGDRPVGLIEIGVSTAQLQSALQSSLQWNLLLAFFEITLVAALGYGLASC